jgi:hypothetical protein
MHGVVVEIFKRETREVVERFLHRRLNFPGCIHALDTALSGLIPTLKPIQLAELRTVMLKNNETVMTEMDRRSRGRHSPVPRSSDVGTSL